MASVTEAQTSRWTRKQSSILFIAAITAFMGTFLISAINVALPAIEKSFNLNAVTLSWIVTSFLLSTAMFLLPVGRWGDQVGVRRIFKAGVAIFVVSTILCGLATSGWMMIVFRFLQGVGAACTSTTGPAILVTAFPPQQRGRVLGISVAGVYIGLAIGPFAGGFITEYLGWRSIFHISALIGVITAVIAFRYLGRDEEQGPTKFRPDLRGSSLYMLGLVALVYGSSAIPSFRGWMLLGGGGASLVFFWLLESRSNLPVIDTKLFTHNRLFAYSNLAALINYSATFAIVFLLSLYLQKIRGLSPRDAGMILVAQPIMMAIFSPITGRLSDRFEPRLFTTLGMSICTLGLFAFAFLSGTTPLWLIVSLLLGVGIGFALFSSPNMNTIMSSVQRNQYGIASGTAASMRVIGQIISMTIVTLFLAGIIGKQTLDAIPDLLFLKTMNWAFITFAIISIFGVWFSYHRGNVQRKQ
jgi:EmrB/QacA subfamily drug resistance transporter